MLVIERQRSQAVAAAGTGSVLSPNILLLLGTLFCTVGGYFADAQGNGFGCFYRTTAHVKEYHDYSIGFRCCKEPKPALELGSFELVGNEVSRVGDFIWKREPPPATRTSSPDAGPSASQH